MTAESATTTKPEAKQENPVLSLLINIVIPVLILKQSDKLGNSGPLIALIIATAFPTVYGIHDYVKAGRTNFISLLGIANTLLNGGFGLVQMEGIWFTVKEAAFPLAIGLIVFLSAFTKKPLIEIMVLNPSVLKLDTMYAKADERGTRPDLKRLMRNATFMFAASFLISSLLNFLVAQKTFLPIDQALPQKQQAEILNGQIADMTWKGFVFIAFPLISVMLAIMFYLFRGIKQLTGLGMMDLMVNAPSQDKAKATTD